MGYIAGTNPREHPRWADVAEEIAACEDGACVYGPRGRATRDYAPRCIGWRGTFYVEDECVVLRYGPCPRRLAAERARRDGGDDAIRR